MIRHVSGESVFAESLDQQDNAVHHVAHWFDDSEYDAAAARLEAAGYPEVQAFKLPIARFGYFDTRAAIGVMTEIVGANADGHQWRRGIKSGKF